MGDGHPVTDGWFPVPMGTVYPYRQSIRVYRNSVPHNLLLSCYRYLIDQRLLWKPNMSKACSRCKIVQPVESFSNSSRSKDGKNGICKECSSEKCKLFREKNPDYGKRYRKEHADTFKKYAEQQKRKDYQRAYYERNKERYIENKRKQRAERPHIEKLWKERYRSKNTERINEYHRKWKSIKRNSDPCYKIRENTSRRIRYELLTLLNHKKTKNTIDYIGCSIEYLKIYVESRFDIGMSWELYGKWHMDHIIPCAYWNLERETDKHLCFHYRNLQPLWAGFNKRKKDHVHEHQVIYYKTFMETLLY